MADMDLEEWQRRWNEGSSPWHDDEVDPMLQKYLSLVEEVSGTEPSILVTLCGKTVDIPWLCSKGYSVTGVEVSSLAVNQLFTENNIPFTTNSCGAFTVYTAADRKLKIYCGNVFKLDPSVVGQFDAIWDCKAIIAINVQDRERYASLLRSLLKDNGCILMKSLVYEQEIHSQQPFSMPLELIKELFGSYFNIRLVEECSLPSDSELCTTFKLPWAKDIIVFLQRS